VSTPFRLCLPSGVLSDLVEQARREAPNECCGLLAGRIAAGPPPLGLVEVRYPLINALASPRRYESEPRSLFDADRDIRGRGLLILAVYHSHPTSPAVPSRTDLERNYSPEVVNLIVSLLSEPPEVRCWWLTEHDYREAEWEVAKENPGERGA
jgi:proteasome lid subunit RPN8/RPN11